MKIGLASENNLPKAYASKTLDDGEHVMLHATGTEKLTISTNSFQSVANILSKFAPEGSATLEPGTTFYIRDGFSDKETTVTANALIDVAKALTAFAVKPGKFIPVMKEDEASGEATTQEVAEQQPVRKTKGRGKKAKAAEIETVKETAAEDHTQSEATTAPPAESAERKKPGRKAAAKNAATPAVAETKAKGRKAKIKTEDVAPVENVPVQSPEPATVAETPAKRRGRPPKNRAVSETAQVTPPKEKAGRKKADAPAQTPTSSATVTPIARTPHQSGGPFPAAMTDNHKNADIGGDVPAFIKELKAFYIIGENDDYRFDFTALEMDPARRRTVIGPAATQNEQSTFGYEVKTKAGEHIGWIIIEAENRFVMVGIPEMDVSSHRNIEGPITKTGIAVANKVANLRAKAA